MKKVIVFKSAILPYSETFIKEQILAYRNWDPLLIGLEKLPGLSLDGLNFRTLRSNTKSFCSRVYSRLLQELNLQYIGLFAEIQKEQANLIHVHFGIEAVAFWPIAKKLKLPLVVTLHGYDINIYRKWWEEGGGGRRNKNYPKRLLDLAKQPNVYFVAVSDAIRERAIEYGIPSDRIIVHYIGIDTKRFIQNSKPIQHRRRRILFVGRLVEKKGVSILIKAFARVKNKISDAELVIIGDGPLLHKYQSLASELQVNIEFLGSCTPMQVKENIDEARIFCLPSITAENGDAEGLGIVILEAQASGVPVLTSARGGATEGIVDGKTGFSFPEKDINALSLHMQSLLTNDDLLFAMSSNGPKFISEKFNIERCTEQLERFYDEVLLRAVKL